MSNGETAVLPHRFHSSFFEFCIALQASVSLFSVDGIPLSNHFKNHFHSVIFLAKIVDEKVQKKDNVGQKLHRKHFLSLIGEWLPIESIIHDHQPEYYAAINQSNAQGEGTVFIEFMLGIIKEALQEAISEQPAEKPTMQSKEEVRWEKIADFLRTNGTIQNSGVQNLLAVSSATASRILNALTKEGKLVKVRSGRYWAYKAAE